MSKAFISYSHADEQDRKALQKHLASLRREGLITEWTDREITIGEDWKGEIATSLDSCDIFIPLVSPDFISSAYCYDVEMAAALQRHQAGTMVVAPVILKYCDWHHTPLGAIQAAPRDGRPVRAWADEDEAWLDVVTQLRKIAKPSAANGSASGQSARGLIDYARSGEIVRSSNLSIRQVFTDLDKDEFLENTLEYFKNYFGNSLEELSRRNEEVKHRFSSDSRSFTAQAYFRGARRCYVRMWIANNISRGIYASNSESISGNSYNHMLTVAESSAGLALSGLYSLFRHGSEPISPKQGAEILWDDFIAPLQSER